MPTYAVTAELFDRCLVDCLVDHTPIVVGVEGYGQTPDEMLEQVVDETLEYTQFPSDEDARVQLRAAIRAAIGGRRFWPVDDRGRDVNISVNPDAKIADEQPSCWFRITVSVKAG